ncbi:copper type II ascorbate-dependent monooxygenase domain protein [Ostertagia ostertagi]
MELHYGILLGSPNQLEPQELDGTVFKILADNTLVPAEVTTYWCIIKRIPQIVADRKHHIIQMNAYVKGGNENVVHHMEIFLCETDDQTERSENCNNLVMDQDARSCSHVIAAWAKGEGPIYYPPEAGLPIGGRTGRKFLKVEIHYNNPSMESGILDGSGFVFHVTPRLRKYDAGIMEVGLIYSDANSIPPGQHAFPLTGHCVADCTSKLPSEGIYIFGSQLHAHLSGRKLFTSHYRQGVKVGEINRDNHYSPHWQHIVQIRPYVHVLPGDVLSTTCVYDTLPKSGVTLGGYGIDEEMCVNYLYYFPASEVEVCKSAVANETLHRYFENITQIDQLVCEKFNITMYRIQESQWGASLGASRRDNQFERLPRTQGCLNRTILVMAMCR